MNIVKAAEISHRLLENGPFCIIHWENSASWPIIYASNNIKALLGYDSDKLVSGEIGMLDLLDEKDLTILDQQIETATNNIVANTRLKPCRIKCSDGESLWVEINLSFIRNDTGIVTEYLGYLRDNSNQIVEVERQKNSDAELRAITNALPDDILLIDRQGLLQRYQIHDLSGKQQIMIQPGLDISEMFPAEFADKVIDYVNQCIDTKSVVISEYNHTFNNQNSDQYIEARFSPTSANEAIIILRDITEQKNHEYELQQQRKIAEEANSAKTKFLSSVTHELKTPLNAINGFAQLIMMYNKNNSNAEFAGEIASSGNLLLSLINDLLDLSQAESGKLALKIAEVNIENVIEEAINTVLPSATQQNITIKYHKPDFTDIQASGDYERLRQVLLNLLSNAIKYNRKDGCVDIYIEKSETSKIQIQVCDTGIGMTKKQLDKLFQPFSRFASNQTEISGSGLGLSITKELIEAMGGKIDVDSEIGIGSQFWIELDKVEVSGKGGV